ncbi:PLAT/LH2 domain-containing protein [Streptomyces clavuligerus]|uniref:Lipoxygenase n=1 Tax=Streptomyces clavuligerus TaxID=1901 RepID=B5H2U4_STRCL|nr:PLAT/LH2 domain-containing protein [Streptomyces clavuligerus]EDY52890.1 hypothetical protein SSCG_05943 [Streptomyces clavuligerus]EFG03638.1 Lipoxygenase [Streptomyces clavuligerus]MBY6307800.1 hypothetical protein [Streptomyces clavuligerus]QCS09650.1 hypothetical protein CRV15_28830 [Streptomyces clavuligerus]QPJ98306.1 hypothetical protein GE265_35520 [Streptomyces clavuligerus]
MTVSTDVPPSPLLDYAVRANPAPLNVSSDSSEPALADIDVIVSNGGGEAIHCRSIVLSLSVGSSARDLTESPETVSTEAIPAGIWTFAPAPATGTRQSGTGQGVGDTPATVRYQATPVSGDYLTLTTDGVAFRLADIPVNSTAGTTRISIEEVSTTGEPTQADNWPTTPYLTSRALTKDHATSRSLVVDSLTVQGDANFQSDLILADQKQIRAVESGTFSVQSAVLESPQISGSLHGADQDPITVASNLQFNDQCVIGPVGDGVLWIKQPHIQGTLLGEDSTLHIGDAVTADKGITATGVSSFEKLQVTSELYGVNGILNVTATTLDAYNMTVDGTLGTPTPWAGYTASITMANTNGAGTDADVYIKVNGVRQNWEIGPLDHPDENDFEQGGTYAFWLDIPYIGDIGQAVIRQSGGAASADMCVQKIVITEKVLNKTYTYDSGGVWIDKNSSHTFDLVRS